MERDAAVFQRCYAIHGVSVRVCWDHPSVAERVHTIFEYFGLVPSPTSSPEPHVTLTFLRTEPLLSVPANASEVAQYSGITARQAESQMYVSDGVSTVQKYLPMEIVDKVLREVRPYHSVTMIAFTGGEPTLHPRFDDIVRRVTAQGYAFGFVTNGWNFQKTFHQVKPYLNSIGHISFSLDGTREATHDTLRRPGSFRHIMQAITLCRFHGIPVYLNTVVTKANRTELEAMAVLASRLGCEALGYGHCQPTPDALAADLVLNARERRDVEMEIAALQKIFNLTIFLAGDHYHPSRFYQCPQLHMREFNIDYRGYLTACCTLSNYRGGAPDTDVLADLREVSFYEAHRRLIAKIAQINLEKIARLSTHEPTEADQFICTHCLLHYKKVPNIEAVLASSAAQYPSYAEDVIHVDI